MLARLQRSNLKLAAAFCIALASLMAQDITNYLTPDVARVGMRLACQCGGCKNTVGDCPMLHCGSADPKRRRIFEMKQRGVSDDEIVNTFVREEGVVALSGPLHHELFVWLMPGIALLLGFWAYSAYVRRNRKAAAPITPVDQALIDRFKSQIDPDLDESKSQSKK